MAEPSQQTTERNTERSGKTLTPVGIWWRWMLATTIGFAIGSIFAFPASYLGLYAIGPWSIQLGLCEAGSGNLGCILRSGVLVPAGVIGLAMGYLQRLLMRRLLGNAGGWIVVATIGWAVVAVALAETAHIPIAGTMLQDDGTTTEVSFWSNWVAVFSGFGWSLLAGLLLGGLQCLLMVRKLRHSWWWCPVNGVLVLFGAIAILFVLRGTGGLLGLWLFFAVFALIYAAISGATLAKIATSQPPQ